MKDWSRNTIIPILFGIVVIAAIMRFYGLDRQSFWYDEVVEESAFQKQFLERNPKKVLITAPPLNSLFVYPMTKLFPRNDLALRMVPLTFGIITIPLLFILARRLFNEKVGLSVSFLLAISPFHIWFSQDIRMYSLQWMLVIISIIFFISALKQPLWRNYIGYFISTLTGLYALQLTVFLIVVQGIYLLLFFHKYKAQFLKWALVFTTTMLFYLPWIIYTLAFLGAGKEAGFYKEMNLNALLYVIYTFCVGFSIGPSLRELHLDQSLSVIKPYFIEIVSAMIVYNILFFLGLWSVRKDHPRLLLLLLLFIVPIISVFILNKVMPNVTYNVRYAGMALFAFLLFIAKGLDWLISLKSKILGKTLAVFSLIAIIGFSTYSYANYQFDKRYHKEDIRGAVAYIKENVAPGDSILCIINQEVFNRYWGEDFGCEGLSGRDKNNKRIEVVLQKTTEGKKRLWLILSREWYADKYGYAKAWLDTNYEEIKHLHKGITEIANVRIYCYDLTRRR